MRQLVFLLEEPSIREVLQVIVPPMLPNPGPEVIYLAHQGKSDLERSLPIKLRAWRTPGTRFVVIRDQDSENCNAVKRKLAGICINSGRADTLIRIACRELEAWLLGDLTAVGRAYGKDALKARQDEAKFRQPDKLGNPAEELARLVPGYQKIRGARAIAPHLDPARNRSESFGFFITGLRRVLDESPAALFGEQPGV